MQTSGKKRRQKSIVDVEVQGAILRRISVHWLLFFIGNSLALLMWVKLFELPDLPWKEVAAECLRRYFPFFLVSLVMLPAFVWDTLKLTTRFAGPIHRLRTALKRVASGEKIKPIKFRHGDFWNEIANNFNRAVGAVDPAHTAEAATQAKSQ